MGLVTVTRYWPEGARAVAASTAAEKRDRLSLNSAEVMT
jgi:2-keto-3-deoxy-L-rhamnonate aldolase RhmA